VKAAKPLIFKAKVMAFMCLVFAVPAFSFANSAPEKLLSASSVSYGPSPNGDFIKLTIPLKRAGNLLLVEALIDSVRGNLILDTGAPHLVLNKTYFRKGKQADGMMSDGITGGGSTVLHTTVGRLEIQELYFKSVSADLVNLGHIEDEKGVKIFGLLGAGIFAQTEIELDVMHDVLYVYKLNQDGERLSGERPALAPNAGLQVPISMEGGVIFLNTSTGGTKLRFCLDTGAEINVLSNEVNKKVLQHFRFKSLNTLIGSGSHKAEVIGGELDELMVGDYTFRNTQMILAGVGKPSVGLQYNVSWYSRL
jgi:predicted aspartyl protease